MKTREPEYVESALTGLPAIDCPHIIAARRVYPLDEPPEGRPHRMGFGVNLVVEGEGRYCDDKGVEYPLRPGSLYVRCGRYPHETHWEEDVQVKEYFISLSRLSFEHLEPLGLMRMPAPPVRDPENFGEIRDAYDGWIERLKEAMPEEGSRILLDLVNWMFELMGDSGKMEPATPHQDLVREVCRYLERHPEVEENLPSVASEFGVSYSLLRKAFTKETGMSLRQYRTNRRIQRTRLLLETHSVSEVAEILGYADSYSFSKRFKQITGISPKPYQKLYYS